MKNGSNGARTRDLSRVRRTLIPAELCFHVDYYSTLDEKCKTSYQAAPGCIRERILSGKTAADHTARGY